MIRRLSPLPFLLAAACSGPSAAYREFRAQEPRSFAGVAYHAVEHAFDGPHEMSPDRPMDVDADSELRVRFEVPARPEDGAPSKEWEALNALPAEVRDLARRRELVSGALDFSTPEKAAATKQAMTDLARKVSQALTKLVEATGATPQELLRIVTGEFDGRKDNQKAYENILRWISAELDRLRREGDDFSRSRERYRVAVEAFLDAGNGRTAVHVENYDSIPAGVLKPVDRWGLKLTPREADELRKKIAGSQAAASLIGEIVRAGPDVAEQVRAVLERELARFRDLFKDGTILAASKDEALRVAADVAKPAPVRAAAGRLAALLEDAGKARQAFRALRGTPDLAAAFGQIETLGTSMKALAASLRALLEDKPSAAAAVEAMGVAAGVDWLEARLAELPALTAVLEGLQALLKLGGQVATAVETLKPHEGRTISRDLGDLPEARVSLQKTERIAGDTISVRVRFLEKGDGGQWDKPAREETYTGRVVLVGLHREVTATVIFARASSGGTEANRWKPGVAATATWHYRIRNPETWFSRTIDFLNPGGGFHLATLDQGDENVELGAGVNASIFNGILTGGFGANLNVDEDRAYYWIGVDLLDVLNKVVKP